MAAVVVVLSLTADDLDVAAVVVVLSLTADDLDVAVVVVVASQLMMWTWPLWSMIPLCQFDFNTPCAPAV